MGRCASALEAAHALLEAAVEENWPRLQNVELRAEALTLLLQIHQ